MYTTKTRAESDSSVARRQVWPHANRYLVLGLSFEDGIFNEQKTTFVPICPHGGERSIWPQNQKWLHKSCLLGGPSKVPRKTEHFEYKHMG